MINIYTDGSCLGNPGKGGWAFIIFNEHNEELNRQSGSKRHTTNQRMELTAIIKALESINIKILKFIEITINTDSQYCKNIATKWINNWKQNEWHTASGKPVKNIDLVKKLYKLIKLNDIKWNWVKGHSINEKNNIVDSMAVEAAKKQL